MSKQKSLTVENEAKIERLLSYLNTVRTRDGMVGNVGKLLRSFNNASKYDPKMGKRNSKENGSGYSKRSILSKQINQSNSM